MLNMAQKDKIKTHFAENKKLYIGIGVGILVGATGVLLAVKIKQTPTEIINNVAPIIAPVFNNDNSSAVNFGGYAHKLVKNLRTGEIWETVKESAEAAGVTSAKMSAHLNGHTDNINGDIFSIIGVGTAA